MKINSSHPKKKVTTRRGRLKDHQRRHLARLLNKIYTPIELATEIDIKRPQIYRVYRHLGMPCEIDATGHVLINGAKFREWYIATYAKAEVGPNQTFCLTCFKPVYIVDPQRREKEGMVFIQSQCPECGRNISKFVANHRREYLRQQQEKLNDLT